MLTIAPVDTAPSVIRLGEAEDVIPVLKRGEYGSKFYFIIFK